RGDVFIYDPRGIGSVRCRDINLHGFYEYYGTEYKLNFDLIMSGTSMTALRVYDILRAFEYVKEVNPSYFFYSWERSKLHICAICQCD
ncbi:MAG TPA: hypothetical protein PK811_06105, partial [bacterium]|nr:hypothetical protein [bacterium]